MTNNVSGRPTYAKHCPADKEEPTPTDATAVGSGVRQVLPCSCGNRVLQEPCTSTEAQRQRTKTGRGVQDQEQSTFLALRYDEVARHAWEDRAYSGLDGFDQNKQAEKIDRDLVSLAENDMDRATTAKGKGKDSYEKSDKGKGKAKGSKCSNGSAWSNNNGNNSSDWHNGSRSSSSSGDNKRKLPWDGNSKGGSKSRK